jgi:hypothetical protein
MKNLILFFILSVILFFLCGLSNKNELMPLEFLSSKSELVVKKYRSDEVDTLHASEVLRLSELKFRKSDLDDISEYGKKYSISLFDKDLKICQLEIQELNSLEYSVTINHFEAHKLYRGFRIEKKKLNELLPVLKKEGF